MSEEYWDRLQELFYAAAALEPAERVAYLDQACRGDESLRRRIESLLQSHDQQNLFIDSPAYQAAAEMLVQDPHLRTGQLISHYKVLSLLGQGGMGQIYLAEDTKLKRKVSLKFLSPKFAEDRERVLRFEQEARAISALNHPNILTIHEIGEIQRVQFIAGEFIDGETLRKRLSPTIDIDEAIDVSIQVAAALVAAHRLNIVHRDIKPENIMIRRDDGLVKVLDFGLAKISAAPGTSSDFVAADPETELKVQTQEGLLLGTVAYMSPEQARGQKVDQRTDIWSLGVVLYEMVAGCTPFTAGSSHEIISAILSKDPLPPLARYRRPVPHRLEEIVEKAIAKNRDERYQTSQDLLIDLKRLKQSLEFEADLERSASSGATTRDESEGASVQTQPASLKTLTAGASGAGKILPHFTHKRLFATLITLALICVLAAFAYEWRLRHASASDQIQIKSLAVLPLKSFDTSENYLGLGITDAIIRRTSQTGELTVRPTSAVLKYFKTDTDSLQAAHQLNADAVLEGTTQRVGDRLRVTVNLLRTRDGLSIWADSFDLPAADIFAIQDKVAQQVANRLQLHLDSSRQAGLSKYPTSPIAYEFYMKGVFNLEERGTTPEDKPQLETTIDFFKKAIEADPNYALAHAQLAFAYGWMALFNEPSDTKWFDLAKAEIKRSEEIGPDIAETHLARALLLWSAYEGYKNDESIRELLLARQLNPNSSHGELAAMYGHIGLDDLAKREVQRGLEIDPTSQSFKDLTSILMFLRSDADEWHVEHQKTPHVFSYDVPWYYLRKGQLDDAQKAIDERMPLSHDTPELLQQMALLLALKGDNIAAEKKIQEVLATVPLNSQNRHHLTYDAACIYALSGKSDEAVSWLKETAATGFPNYPLFARDPYLDRIRKAPQFVQFMSEQKAQWEKWQQEFGN
jgi:serine/threonine-protein kinase